ncbi:MAG TPA: hypothetical protein DEB40_13430 [Elusimicrobia bacterium]|nr:hypothetical protein [Elusimicrobiota bacterium]HBT62735.1 hypothetical protein [Elusimicrobiota bacterium]
MIKINAWGLLDRVKDEFKLITATIQEKGVNRFGRVLILSMAVPFCVYKFIYLAADGKYGKLDKELSVAKTTSQYADSYKQLKSSLLAPYDELPPAQDRAKWLSDKVRDALRAEGLVATQLQPPQEEAGSGSIVQSLNVMIDVSFPELLAFVARLEESRPRIHVRFIELAKKPHTLGRNEVTCIVSTVFITERY